MEEKGKFEKQIEKWAKIRKSKWTYIILSALFRGVWIAFFLALFDLTQKEFSLKKSIFFIIAFFVVGFFFDMWQWEIKETQNQKYKIL